MIKEFIVTSKFTFTIRKSFVLIGYLKDGYLEKGMILSCPEKNFNKIINSVEHVSVASGDPLIGLIFDKTDENELTILNNLNSSDYIIII